ncbi:MULTISPECIES: SpoIIE family protein phosphatase/ATP-binding protein [unclassified Streptomyces]|uniref:SpoIIE family protein phosphatase/ATP-binding protein n=1 Tax=unclassified Streptomyces TaxID=2593676 RepID=UPI0022716921|nr:SpoIIE family protein phosphatase/ATP-binding protein [Streptomyces sp. H27-G5]MCY0922302.1 SpoIIE family protein phosphatase [Streptomyces sp. H27-G5]
MRSLSRNRPRSVARQVFVLQVAIVVLLAAGAVLALVLQSRHDVDREARTRSVSVAQTVAHSTGMCAALRSSDPAKTLQPLAESTRKDAGVDFIVVMDTEGIRYSHPLPDRIGKRFVGTIEPSLAGEVHTESVQGPLGKEIQAIVPVYCDGKVTGLVSAGLTVKNVSGVVDRQLPVILGASAAGLALATVGAWLISRRLRRQTHGLGPEEMTRMYEHHDAVLHSVREGVLITDGGGRLLLANDEAKRLLKLPADAEGQYIGNLSGLDRTVCDLLLSGRVATDEVHEAGERLLVINQRPTRPGGGPEGAAVTIRDSTEMRVLSTRADAARRRLRLLYDAGVGVGTTLDVGRTAQELADVAVPRFADFATVELAEAVLHGDEPNSTAPDLLRTGFSGIADDVPLYPRGRLIDFRPSTPQARGLTTGRAELIPDLADAPGWYAQDPERAQAILDYGVHSLITAPLKARGAVLGLVNFWRSRKDEPFDEEDLSLAEELVARAGVTIDNARRYTREHALAVTLQRSLLPRDLPEQSGVEVAHFYLPAQSGVGGDWFDVIPLPGSRVALVVGDVVGHGLHAAAAMGRLRTAVLNFSSLDLPPDELLSRLDDLVQYIDQGGDGGSDGGLLGATCLYAVYDAVTQRCTVARAGHVPPAIVRPDGSVEIPELPAGAPLGLGGFPFESTELELPEGSQLVLYTDGLIEDRARDIDEGLDLLRAALAHADRKPEDTCRAVLAQLLPVRSRDDVALLVARTSALPADRIAEWEVPFEPSSVGAMRAHAVRKLEEWGLSELAFGTELVLSELVTNAIRHGSAPVRVRLLFDRMLTCEVFDGSSSSPRLHYATTTDEGGRGLFLVAQISRRWGARYTPDGKVLWSEQALPEPEDA